MKKNTLNARFEVYRTAQRLTKAQFARDIGIDQGNMGAMLRGTRGVTADLIESFLRAYPDVSAEWLLRGEGEMLRTAPATASLSIGGDNNGTASISARGNTTTHTTNNYGGCPETMANEKLDQQALTDLRTKMAVLEERTKSLTSLLDEKDRIIKLFERLTDK